MSSGASAWSAEALEYGRNTKSWRSESASNATNDQLRDGLKQLKELVIKDNVLGSPIGGTLDHVEDKNI